MFLGGVPIFEANAILGVACVCNTNSELGTRDRNISIRAEILCFLIVLAISAILCGGF